MSVALGLPGRGTLSRSGAGMPCKIDRAFATPPALPGTKRPGLNKLSPAACTGCAPGTCVFPSSSLASRSLSAVIASVNMPMASWGILGAACAFATALFGAAPAAAADPRTRALNSLTCVSAMGPTAAVPRRVGKGTSVFVFLRGACRGGLGS
eukprot:2569445-Amphidinium_carterae.1